MRNERKKKIRKIIRKEARKNARKASENVIDLIYSQSFCRRVLFAYKVIVKRR